MYESGMKLHIMSGPHQGAGIVGEPDRAEYLLPDPCQRAVQCRYSINTPDEPVMGPDGPEVQLHFAGYVRS